MARRSQAGEDSVAICTIPQRPPRKACFLRTGWSSVSRRLYYRVCRFGHRQTRQVASATSDGYLHLRLLRSIGHFHGSLDCESPAFFRKAAAWLGTAHENLVLACQNANFALG